MANVAIDELIKKFLKRGGHINRYYLQNSTRNKRSLVYLNGWFGGQNIREAIQKALGGPGK
jgi:hypothetical protein